MNTSLQHVVQSFAPHAVVADPTLPTRRRKVALRNPTTIRTLHSVPQINNHPADSTPHAQMAPAAGSAPIPGNAATMSISHADVIMPPTLGQYNYARLPHRAQPSPSLRMDGSAHLQHQGAHQYAALNSMDKSTWAPIGVWREGGTESTVYRRPLQTLSDPLPAPSACEEAATEATAAAPKNLGVGCLCRTLIIPKTFFNSDKITRISVFFNHGSA